MQNAKLKIKKHSSHFALKFSKNLLIYSEIYISKSSSGDGKVLPFTLYLLPSRALKRALPQLHRARVLRRAADAKLRSNKSSKAK
jgi:hypothetical protein